MSLIMVVELLDRNEVNCKELSIKFVLSQPTLSHHYNMLIAAGILSSRNERLVSNKLNQDRLLASGINYDG
jgi:DNA-binding transcriptional ArsR family regulator